jgi:DNA primase
LQIPRETIDLIRDRISIEDIIKRYVPTLSKRGKSYLGLCPFHNEKTPSFTVTPDKQLFYCFGCHAGGNIFTFISKIEKLSFPESVKFLGNIAGIEIENKSDEESEKIADFYKLNSFALNEFHNFLKSPSGKKGLDYLINRGVSNEAISQFKIGFAPESWNFLTDKIKKMKNSISPAEELGLVSSSIKNDSKHYFDRYRNRVIFPIFDKNGKPVAFGGRILTDGKDKYINSPESEIFKKRNILYGYNFALESIKEMKRAIIVEGYLDVIGCHQAGIKNCVAPLGTALSDAHVKILSRDCTEIILLFDSDSAGMNAALRSLPLFSEISIDLKIAMLPEGDPFDYIKKFGMRRFMSVVDESLKPVDFRINMIISEADKINQTEIKTLVSLFAVIKDIRYESEKDTYLKKISRILKLDENSVRKDFEKFNKNQLIREKPVSDNVREKPDFNTRGIGDLIYLILNYPSYISKASIDFTEFSIQDGHLKNILNKMMEMYNSGVEITADKMFDFFQDGKEFDFLNQSMGKGLTFDNPDAAYNEIYISMKLHDIDAKIGNFAALIKNKNTAGNDYIAEIEILRREKEKFNNYIHKTSINKQF